MTQAADEKIPFHRNWNELIKPEKLEIDKEKHNETYGKFICQPLERGFAATIGNSLRRILLSSLDGAAVYAVKIHGADHEFMTIPGVLEDVADIILNVKQLRPQLFSDGPELIVLDVDQVGRYSAGKIELGKRFIAELGDDEFTRYAEAHRDVIERFGRFPHRNAILGRPPTDEETAFLQQPGSAF